MGFAHHLLPLSRPGIGMVREIRSALAIWRLVRRLRPDIVHLVTIKPVIYGGLAARLARVPAVVSAISGLGYVFLARGTGAALRRRLVFTAYRIALGHPNGRVIFQNRDDATLLEAAVPRGHSALIRGSGVDPTRFRVFPLPEGPPLVVLAARLLWDKGVGEFVEAARILSERGVRARFALVGETDSENRSGIPADVVEEWRRDGVVEIWGRRDDMPEVFAQSTLVCLPSYREGLPKVLIEAAACGRAIVTTDVPGCREIVRDRDNGLLVPARDAQALAEGLRELIEDRELRDRMGVRGRERVEAEFADEHVVRATLDLYAQLLPSDGVDSSLRSARELTE